MATKPARTRTTRTPRTSDAPTLAACTTLGALVAFARTITVANFADMIGAVVRTFPVAHAARNIGRTTNRRIMDFQNVTLADNVTWQLDDVQLAWLWRAEFPAASGRVFTGHPSDMVSIVRGVRALYNAGRHANTNGVPSVASVAYGENARVRAHVLFPRPVPAAPVPVVPNVPATALNPAKRNGKSARKRVA